jgi:hypothetical protein
MFQVGAAKNYITPRQRFFSLFADGVSIALAYQHDVSYSDCQTAHIG